MTPCHLVEPPFFTVYRARGAMKRQAFCSPARWCATLHHLIVASLLLLTGCDRETISSAEPLHPDDIRTFVTSELAASLTPDGHFTLQGPLPDPYPQIAPERAAEIAIAHARTFGPFHRSYLENGHGRRIDFDALQVGSPVYYARSPYIPPPAGLHPGIHNRTGPYYLVYLVSPDGTPVLSVGVAAYTQAWIDEEGFLQYPPSHGSDVLPQGVRTGRGFVMPVSPEQAVRLVGLATGARTVSAPEFVLPSSEYAPHYARWKIDLDRPVTARSRDGQRVITTREVYVGLWGEFFIPAADQPEGRPLLRDNQFGLLARRPEWPVSFQPVTLSAQ